MELLAILFIALIVVAIVAAGLTVLEAAFHGIVWLILLPIKILFALLLLPFLLLKVLVGLVIGVVMLPVAAIVALVGLAIGIVAFGAFLLVPLLPLLIVALLVWAAVKVIQPTLA